MEGNSNFLITYEYNNKFYDIEASEDVHTLLKNDTNFFEQYVLNGNQSSNDDVPARIIGNGAESGEDKTLKWTKQTSMLLIHSYKKRKEDFRNPKIKKRSLWTSIKEEFFKHGHIITEDDLDRKWRNLKKTYTGLVDNKKSSGRGRIYWDYFDDFQEIYSTDKSINLPETISSIASTSSSVIPISSSSIIPITSPVIPNGCSSIIPIASSVPPPLQVASSSKYVNLAGPSTPKHSAASPSITSLPCSSVRDEEKHNKRMRNKNLYHMRKQVADLEEKRLEELTKIRLAIEESNRIQRERNEIFKKLAEK